MDTTEVRSLLEDLSGNIDDLEDSLEPLLKASLSTITSRAPLLDKAKIYVLATYAIESILFSYLRLNGVDAKEHAVFKELTRVKEYFDKIKLAETGPTRQSTTLDKTAAARFIKQGLAGNNKYDQERFAREQTAVKRRADAMEQTSQWGSHNRFESTAKRITSQESGAMVAVVKADTLDNDDEDEDEDEGKESSMPTGMNKAERKAARRQQRLQARLTEQSQESPASHLAEDSKIEGQSTPNEHKKKRRKKTRSEMRQVLEDERAQEMM